jgi:hypothetical protein
MRRRVDRTIRVLIVLNIVVIALLAGTMVAQWVRIIPPQNAVGTSGPSESPSPEVMQMGLAHIPTSNACVLCHYSGGEAGLKPIPALAHPLEGWTSCLTCHTDESLGRTAPGHEGIAQSECLNCHKEAPQLPITQAHANLNEPCLDCHGTVAHLPSSMVGRNQDDCSLCHKPNPSPPPVNPHPDMGDLNCRSCHQAGNVGALPIDHALRGDDTCILCHEVGGGSLLSPRPTPSPKASSAGT